jgi:MerR HTH family regulatory protein
MHDTYLDEMATRLRVNPATLQYWASRHLIPAIKDARGRYLFDESEVLRVVADWPPTPPTSIRRRMGPRPMSER